jgi:hypothetical protein
LQEIKKYEIEVASNGIIFIPKFIKIHAAVADWKFVNLWTDEICTFLELYEKNNKKTALL